MANETRVYLAQIKCPAGHCIIAAAGEYESFEAAEALRVAVTDQLASLIEKKVVRAECAICKATAFHTDLNRTPFKSVDEAALPLAVEEIKQMKTQEYLRQSKN